MVVLALVAAAVAVAVVLVVVQRRDNDGPRTIRFTVDNCARRASAAHGMGCRGGLQAAVAALRPGDTLLIAPGTYAVGSARIDPAGDAPGADRITIAAADPSRPPVLRGYWRMEAPYNVTVSGLRLEASGRGKPAISTRCGAGWVVEDSSISGAASTGDFANFVIAGNRQLCPGEPRDFTVRGNRFSRPTVVDDEQVVFYHHIYASFEGTPDTGGVIERNVFRGMRSGAGVKLGNNGAARVLVAYNTFFDGAYAVLITYDARENVVRGNLVVRMRGGPASAEGSAVAVAQNPDRSNRIEGNYTYDVERLWGEITSDAWSRPSRPPTIGDGNVAGPDPMLDVETLVPRAPRAQRFGHAARGA